jgi:hypothetical protein
MLLLLVPRYTHSNHCKVHAGVSAPRPQGWRAFCITCLALLSMFWTGSCALWTPSLALCPLLLHRSQANDHQPRSSACPAFSVIATVEHMLTRAVVLLLLLLLLLSTVLQPSSALQTPVMACTCVNSRPSAPMTDGRTYECTRVLCSRKGGEREQGAAATGAEIVLMFPHVDALIEGCTALNKIWCATCAKASASNNKSRVGFVMVAFPGRCKAAAAVPSYCCYRRDKPQTVLLR